MMLDQQAKQWAVFLHLSQFLSYLIPLAGVVVPLAIWLVKKDQLPGLDTHGRNVMNWLISAFIYAAVGLILAFIGIGFLILLPLGICAIAFPIVGAINASDGKVWRYPLSIRFL
jgi:hypothetical protein